MKDDLRGQEAHFRGTSLSLPRHVERFHDVASDGPTIVLVRGAEQGTSDLVLAERLVDWRARRKGREDVCRIPDARP